MYGDIIQTAPEQIMDSIDAISQRKNAEIRTPKFADAYVEEKYGRGFRMLGRKIDSFESVPEDRDSFGITPSKEIVESTNHLDGVVIATNNVHLLDE